MQHVQNSLGRVCLLADTRSSATQNIDSPTSIQLAFSIVAIIKYTRSHVAFDVQNINNASTRPCLSTTCSSSAPLHDICAPANTIYSTSFEPGPCLGAELSIGAYHAAPTAWNLNSLPLNSTD